jgi:hypothetical protein
MNAGLLRAVLSNRVALRHVLTIGENLTTKKTTGWDEPVTGKANSTQFKKHVDRAASGALNQTRSRSLKEPREGPGVTVEMAASTPLADSLLCVKKRVLCRLPALRGDRYALTA